MEKINPTVRTYFLKKRTQHNRYRKENNDKKDKGFKKIFKKELQKQK